jgi:hypothetical protein
MGVVGKSGNVQGTPSTSSALIGLPSVMATGRPALTKRIVIIVEGPEYGVGDGLAAGDGVSVGPLVGVGVCAQAN